MLSILVGSFVAYLFRNELVTVNIIAPDSLTMAKDQAREVLRRDYGLESIGMTRMQSELATVFRVELSDGRVCAFKAMCDTADARKTFRWQVDGMERLQRHGIPSGATYRTRDNGLISVSAIPPGSSPASATPAQATALVHVGEWLTGTPLERTAVSARAMRAVGATAAAVTGILAHHPRPPVDIQHPWELARTMDSLHDTIPAIKDPDVRDLLRAAEERFAVHVQPALSTLPHSVVHQDLHDSNLLMDETGSVVSGVLDFGDMVWGPRIADIAVAAAYGSRNAADPASAYLQVVDGWSEEACPERVHLEEVEIAALLDASIGRLAVNLGIWTARGNGERGEYARARSVTSAHALRALLGVDADEMRDQIGRRIS